MCRNVRLIITGLALLGVGLTAPTAPAQLGDTALDEQDERLRIGTAGAELYTRVRLFDFDERKLGNFEETPMHWVQLRGDGLPTLYAKGSFDEEVGHTAAPSFRLDIATGNVAYEYRNLDLTVVHQSDYFVVAYVRPAGLRFAAAFVAAYFVDRFGERIEGSQRISNLVRATGRDPEPWQRVQIDLPGEFPLAHALRLQLWILQDYVWRKPDPRDVDPIIRRDVHATAWFDELSVYRLPRVQLHFSNPAGLVLPGKQEEFILDVNNATSQALKAELGIIDSGGRVCHRQELDVPTATGPVSFTPPSATSATTGTGDLRLALDLEGSTAAVHAPVPKLAPGLYTGRLRLLGGSETLLERTSRFAVLPELPADDRLYPDIGVDIGPWQGGSIAGLRELLVALGCGAVKIGIPMAGALNSQEKSSYFQDLSQLLRALAENRIDATGVILVPPGEDYLAAEGSTRRLVASGEAWRQLFSPVLAHFGALLPTWQLGSEAIELRNGGRWQPADVERVRSHLCKFITIPKLAIPQRITALEPRQDDIVSVWVPADLPTRALPRQLDFLVDDDASSYWLQLAPPARGSLSPARLLDDLVRRVVLAQALGPQRVFLPAPFTLSRGSGQPAWQPTEDFLILRTLFRCLSGKHAVGAMTPAADTLAVVFEGTGSSCMVVWSWRETAPTEPVELYLGSQPQAIDLWGQPIPLKVVAQRTRLPVGPTPIIVKTLNTPLALLQASYRIAPTYVQVHKPEPRPVVTFRNPYDTRLSGEVRLTPPGNWQVEPTICRFLLEPGEIFAEPITLTLPPRQTAQGYTLDVRLTLHSPESTELCFPEALTVGLCDIGLDATTYWDGDSLVLQQSLQNLSGQPVNFTAFCDAPGYARQERFFSNVAPGEVSIQTYVFPNGRELAGTSLPIGVQEIGGKRSLNQFAEVPP